MHVFSEDALISSSPFDVYVVNEFKDGFPEELSGLPLQREIKFAIELYFSSVPLSKVLYYMLPTELLELKKQIEELLERGFIYPNVFLCIIYVENIW